MVDHSDTMMLTTRDWSLITKVLIFIQRFLIVRVNVTIGKSMLSSVIHVWTLNNYLSSSFENDSALLNIKNEIKDIC